MDLIDIIYSNGVSLDEFLEFLKKNKSNLELIRPHLLNINWKPLVIDYYDADKTNTYEEENINILFKFYNELSEFELINLRNNLFPSLSFLNYFDENTHNFSLSTLEKATLTRPEIRELLICSDYLKFDDIDSFKEYFEESLYIGSGFDEDMFEFYPKRKILTLLNKNTVSNIKRYYSDLNIIITLDIIDLIELKRFGYIETYNESTLKSLIGFIDVLMSDREFTEKHISNFTLGDNSLYDLLISELSEVKKYLEYSLTKRTDFKSFKCCQLIGKTELL